MKRSFLMAQGAKTILDAYVESIRNKHHLGSYHHLHIDAFKSRWTTWVLGAFSLQPSR